jgi:AraC-like DNA-binding protein
MKNPPHKLIYYIQDHLNFCVYPKVIHYTLEKSKSYFLYAKHYHPEHELIFVSKGIYKSKVNGSELQLEPGEVLIICPGDYHTDAVYDGLQFHSIRFVLCSNLLPGKTLRLFKENIDTELQIIKPPSDLISDFKAVADGVEAHQLSQVISSRLNLIFWRIVQQIPPERLSKTMELELSGNSLIAGINRAIYENIFTSPLTVKRLAALLGMSPSKLTSLCSEILNSSPAKLIMRVKMDIASNLLLETDMTIKEISSTLQFADQFSFSRAFKRFDGRPPRKYRREQR